MKKLFLMMLTIASVALMAQATDLTGKRIYVNPGHGSYGPNDRPMATIPYPNLPTTGMPDTLGFYESNTDMWKCEYLRDRLREAGAYVMMSREQSGPWPYEMVNGDYPSYSYDDYKNRSDYEQFNRALSEICEEVEANNMDYFISVHSNAATDGTTTNFPLFLYRGQNNGTSEHEVTSKAMGAATWPWRWEMFGAGFDYASGRSLTNMYLAGDWDFYGSHSVSTRSNGKRYDGYLGVLKHGTPGGLWEGYFHTYQPARHRALNYDYCKMEGLGYFRGIMDYFSATPDSTGYICGTVKDMDKKMNHPLFMYAPKTNDQWIPCNGATVYLLNQGGDTLQTYHVDSLYNGIFAFYNLTPGTYRLAAECPGYASLDEEQSGADVVVTANHTTYPFLYLRDTAWAPEPIVYETYPDKSTGASGLNGKYNFGAAQSTSFASVVAGKEVRQVLVRDDAETYVLALDTTAKTSHIYKIGTMTGNLIAEVSTAGTQGEIYPVYNLAFTADSVLVGCNYTENQFDNSHVADATTGVRGTFRTYYWNMDDLTAAPAEWFSTQYSAAYYNAWIGESFAVSGKLDNANVYTDLMTIYGSTNIRLAMFTTEDKQLITVVRNQSDVSGVIAGNAFGKYTAMASPNADDNVMLLGSTKSMEYTFTSDAQLPNIFYNLPAAKGAGAFKYGGKSVVAAPVVANGQVTGVRMFNITAGLGEATTSETNIALAEATKYYSVKPLASGKDIVMYVATDDHIYRFTTAGQTQPKLSNIYAYDLNLVQNEDGATFTFSLNTDPTSASVIVYKDEQEVKRYVVGDAQKGANTLTVAAAQLPVDSFLTWAVEASAPTVGNMSSFVQKTPSELGGVRLFNAVNIFPETDRFGTIYIMDRAGANDQKSGLHIMSPDYVLENTTAYKGGQPYYGSPYRFGIASDGALFIGDWADPHSGVYVAEEANVATVHTNFFAGSQNSAGLWKNAAGVEEGSSTSSVFVYGTGANTKLLVYNEDPGQTLPTNGLCVYNIGQEDGTILHSWDGAPSQKMTFAGQANTNGNVWGCSHGVWVSQHRGAGNNNASATSLRFYNWNGECTYSSHQGPVDQYDLLIIDGSLGSVYALSPDEKTLILNGCDNEFLVFNVTWEGDTPNLSLAYRYKHTEISDNGVGDGNGYGLLQMNWDYAGNLIITGQSGLIGYGFPKELNKCVTPAKSTMLINASKQEPVEDALENISTVKSEKFYLNGQIYIRRGNHVYTVTGVRVE